MNDERIDLSALDPTWRPRRWEALVQRTLVAARPEPLWLAVSRRRSLVAALAAVALLSWLPAVLTRESPVEPAKTTDPALALLEYSRSGDVLAVLESTHGR